MLVVATLIAFAIPHATAAPIDEVPKLERQARLITQTIAEKETAGTLDCSLKGLSGETGCFQYMPGTWRGYSLEVYGEVLPQTPERAQHVTYTKVLAWLEEGYSPRDIFLTWNQGNRGPCIRGTNDLGVEYDSCSYAEDALRILASYDAQ